MFHQSEAENAREFCLHVLEKLQEFTCTPPTHDDVTALALARHRTADTVATAI
jgi:hypothetical protein